MHQEKSDTLLTVTDLGRKLLDKSRWFSCLLYAELVRLGVGTSDVLLEYQTAGEEMDCLAVISGELVFFELKDKEFGLGNAYSFGAKIGIVRPNHSVIITTEHVSNDVKTHFARSFGPDRSLYERTLYQSMHQDGTQTPVIYIEGIENLRGELEKIADKIYSQDAEAALSEGLSRASLSPRSLLAVLGKSSQAG